MLPEGFFVQIGPVLLVPHQISGVKLDYTEDDGSEGIAIWTTDSTGEPFFFDEDDEEEYEAALRFLLDTGWTTVYLKYDPREEEQ